MVENTKYIRVYGRVDYSNDRFEIYAEIEPDECIEDVTRDIAYQYAEENEPDIDIIDDCTGEEKDQMFQAELDDYYYSLWYKWEFVTKEAYNEWLGVAE